MIVLAINGRTFTKQVDNPKTKFAAWHSRKLSVFERCFIANTQGLSQIVYSVSMDDTPNKYASLIQSLLFQFLWKNNKEIKINRKETRMVKDGED